METPVIVGHEKLQAFITSVLEAFKMPRQPAELTALLMTRTDLRGVDSHGIGMLPRYVEWIRGGFIAPWAEPVIARDDMATGLVDGQQGLGYYPATMAMELAIARPEPTASGSWR